MSKKQQLVTPSTIAERDRLRVEVEHLRTALGDAEQRIGKAYEAENEAATKHRGALLHDGHPLREAGKRLAAARNERDAVRDRLRDAERTLARLEATISAPERAAAAQAEIDAVAGERARIEAAIVNVAAQSARLQERDADLADREAEAERNAADALLANQPATAGADAVARLAADRRVVRIALDRLATEADKHRADLDALRDRQQAARDALRDAATVVAELELAAALRPVMPVMVKAALMRGDDPRRIEIAIPQDVLDAVEREMSIGPL